MEKKIVKCVLERPTGGSGVFDLGRYSDGTSPSKGTQRLKMEFEDGSIEYMEYYGDEIYIGPQEVIGKTSKEAWKVFAAKDKAYLQG
jgi:hypothetical protein